MIGRLETLNLPFALDDQPHGGALHPPRREALAGLPGKFLADQVAYETI